MESTFYSNGPFHRHPVICSITYVSRIAPRGGSTHQVPSLMIFRTLAKMDLHFFVGGDSPLAEGARERGYVCVCPGLYLTVCSRALTAAGRRRTVAVAHLLDVVLTPLADSDVCPTHGPRC